MVRVVRNTPLLDRLEKEIKYLQNHGVIVGIFGKKGNKYPMKINKMSVSSIKHKTGFKTSKKRTTIVEYAICLNEGTPKMEKKPFFYETTGNKESKKIIRDKQKELLRQVYLGKITGEQCLMQLGIFVSQRIKDKIINNDYENSPQRIKQKKRNKYNTLRENDFMLNAVSFEIITLK